ncbi:MAG: hypothetical protein H0U73_00850 [Tatlockia sp.]|nr:hypothetical protein [Tatlockia sp.]
MLRGVLLIFTLIGSFGVFAEDTELKLYRPFVNEAQLVITKKIAGECLQQSQRIKRDDAWRCSAEGKVYDPCFIKTAGSGKEAFCPESPWGLTGLIVNLSSAANNSQHIALDMSEAFPWAVELTTGEKCQAVDEGEVYDGLRVHYQCNSQTVLIGHVQRCDAKWSILQRSAKGVGTAVVARAWF